ncbi:MAG: TspO/MBR family protein [Novosphingobium sp.]
MGDETTDIGAGMLLADGPPPSSRQPSGSPALWALLFIPLVVGLGLLSGRLSGSGAGNAWFDTLAKPSIYPPPVTFAIVWSALYVLLGVALALVVAAPRGPGRSAAIRAFVVQLALNLAWSPLFFGQHSLPGALALLIVLVIAALLATNLMWRVKVAAGALMLPYLAWLLFAALLNWRFLALNPGA